MKVTNNSNGPRGVNAAHGEVVFLDAGQSRDVEMTKAEIASAKKTGWFDLEGEATDEDEHDDAGHTLKHVGGGRYRIMLNDAPVDETIYQSKAEGEDALKALKDHSA